MKNVIIETIAAIVAGVIVLTVSAAVAKLVVTVFVWAFTW